MVPNSLPIYDRHQALKVTGNNNDLADDLLNMLLNRLEQDIEEINITSKSDDLKKLYACTHKLLGAVRYCGLPRIEFVLNLIESHSKRNLTAEAIQCIQALNQETHKVMQTFSSKVAC